MKDSTIYEVQDQTTKEIHLVEASSRAGAIAYLARKRWVAKPMSVRRFAELIASGAKVQMSGADDANS